MNIFINVLNNDQLLFGIPGDKVAAVIAILITVLLMRRFFSIAIIRYLKHLSQKSNTTLDDALVNISEKPLSLLILLVGLSACRIILVPYVSPDINTTVQKMIQFFMVVAVCWFIHNSADILTIFFEKITRRTKTELDDLLLPYISKTVKTAALLVVIIKAAEVFLGMSAAALLGLLGGMGITLGLVFRDIIACWFGCVIIFLDNIFREGDWVQLDDGKVIDADVEHIGVRSTRFRNFDNTLSIVPNSVITASIVKNWSKMHKRRVKYSFTLDGISAKIMETILSGIRDIIDKDENVHQDFHMVNFRGLEGNARTVRLYYFTKTTLWKEHEAAREKINLKILKLFEDSGIERLAYSIVDLSDDRPHDFQVKREE